MKRFIRSFRTAHKLWVGALRCRPTGICRISKFNPWCDTFADLINKCQCQFVIGWCGLLSVVGSQFSVGRSGMHSDSSPQFPLSQQNVVTTSIPAQAELRPSNEFWPILERL